MKKVLTILLALAMVFSMAGVVSAETTDVTYQVAEGYEASLPVSGVTLVSTEEGYDSVSENYVGVITAQIAEDKVLSICVDSANDFNVVATSSNTVSKVPYKAGIPDENGVYSDISNGAEVLRIGIGDDYKTSMKFYTTTKWTKQAKISTEHRDTLTFTYEFSTICDEWDGTTVDTSWYNDEDSEFTLTSAEQLAGLGSLVDTNSLLDGSQYAAEASLFSSFAGPSTARRLYGSFAYLYLF